MGLYPVSKASSIRDGCMLLMNALADPVIPLVVSTKCQWLIKAFSTIRPDKNQPEVYDERSQFTHILDALRYFFVNQAEVRSEDDWIDIDYDSLPQPNMFF